MARKRVVPRCLLRKLLNWGPTARKLVVPYLLRKLVDYKHYVQYVQWYCREGRAAGEQAAPGSVLYVRGPVLF